MATSKLEFLDLTITPALVLDAANAARIRGDFNVFIIPDETDPPKDVKVYLDLDIKGQTFSSHVPYPEDPTTDVWWTAGNGNVMHSGIEPESGISYKFNLEIGSGGSGKFKLLRVSQ